MSKAKYTLKNWTVTQTIRGEFVSGTITETNRPSSMPVGSRITSAKLTCKTGKTVFTEHAIYTLA